MSLLEGQEGYEPAASDRGPRRAAGRTPARIIAMMLALAFLGFGARQVLADPPPPASGEIFSPCWTREECLNLTGTPGSSAVRQSGLGECANNRCFCPPGGDCLDTHRKESNCPATQGKCYSNPPPVPLTVTIGGAARVVDLGDYIAKVYQYGVSIAGILAGVMFVVGGFQYLTAGSSGRVTKAKERIKDALIGLMLVFGSYVILNTINPDVLQLQMPKMPLVKTKLSVACQYFNMQRPCGQRFTLIKIPGTDGRSYAEQYRVSAGGSDEAGAVETMECIGMSCSRIQGKNDATSSCQPPPGVSPSAATSAPAPVTADNACITAAVAPYQCLPCTPFGGDCRGSGPNAQCCSGFCSGGKLRSATGDVGALAAASGTGGPLSQGHCSNGMDGQRCGVDKDCYSHHCADIVGSGFGGACVSGLEGSPCSEDKNCEGGRVCVAKNGIHACVTPGYMSPCADQDDCAGTGLTCDHYRCGGSGYVTCEEIGEHAECPGSHGRYDPFGPLYCWTQETHWFSSDDKYCKPYRPGAVCHVGDGGHGQCTVCYDGGIWDRAIISPGAGICNSGGPGEGCDNDGDCTRTGRSRAVCSSYPGWLVSDHTCTREGTEGMPCGEFFGPASLLFAKNTCNEGLECPDTVFRCVAPPSTVCPNGYH